MPTGYYPAKAIMVNDPVHHPKDWLILLEVEYCPYCGEKAQEILIEHNSDILVYHNIKQANICKK